MYAKKSNLPNIEESLNVDSLVNIFNYDVIARPSNIFNKEAKRYVVGYLVKKCLDKIKTSCIRCKRELLSTIPPTNKDYILEREYTRKPCTYP